MRKPGPVKAQSFLKLNPGWDKAAGQSQELLFPCLLIAHPIPFSPVLPAWMGLAHGGRSPDSFGSGAAAPSLSLLAAVLEGQ